MIIKIIAADTKGAEKYQEEKKSKNKKKQGEWVSKNKITIVKQIVQINALRLKVKVTFSAF